MICHQCGKNIPNEARFCTECGAEIATANSANKETSSAPSNAVQDRVQCAAANPQGALAEQDQAAAPDPTIPEGADKAIGNDDRLKQAKELVNYGWRLIKSKERYSYQAAGVLFRLAATILVKLRADRAGFTERDAIVWKALNSGGKPVDPTMEPNLADWLNLAKRVSLVNEEEYRCLDEIRRAGNAAAHEVIARNTNQARWVRNAGYSLNQLIGNEEKLAIAGNGHAPTDYWGFYSECLRKCMEDQKKYKGFISRNEKKLKKAADISEVAKALEEDKLKSNKLSDWTNEYYDALSLIDPGGARAAVRTYSGFAEQGGSEPAFDSDASHPSDPAYWVQKPSGYRYTGVGALIFIGLIVLGLCFMAMRCIGIV